MNATYFAGIVDQITDFIETISDPSEIQKIIFDLVKSAKEEITILFSTVNAFKRQEHAGLMWLLQERDPSVRVKILIPTAHVSESAIKYEFVENPRIEIRYFLDSSVQTILASLIVDRKICLVVELKDDKKDNSYKAVGSATYSNSESLVWTHASIFETLWIKPNFTQQIVFLRNKPSLLLLLTRYSTNRRRIFSGYQLTGGTDKCLTLLEVAQFLFSNYH